MQHNNVTCVVQPLQSLFRDQYTYALIVNAVISCVGRCYTGDSVKTCSLALNYVCCVWVALFQLSHEHLNASAVIG